MSLSFSPDFPSVPVPPARSAYSTFTSLPLRTSLLGMWSCSPGPSVCHPQSALLKIVFMSSGSAFFLTGRPRALKLQGVHESAPLIFYFPRESFGLTVLGSCGRLSPELAKPAPSPHLQTPGPLGTSSASSLEARGSRLEGRGPRFEAFGQSWPLLGPLSREGRRLQSYAPNKLYILHGAAAAPGRIEVRRSTTTPKGAGAPTGRACLARRPKGNLERGPPSGGRPPSSF